MNSCAESKAKKAIENGLLVLDKPAGVTSHDVVNQVRRLVGERRVGHAGTLDPAATGVLVVAIGRATGVLRFLDLEPKRYRACVRLGWETTTLDAEGERVGEIRPVRLGVEEIAGALERFRGRIEQTPPMVSALKVKGVALHRLARRGIEVERVARPVTIHRLTLEEYRAPVVTLQVTCSSGTYVRSLAQDLGRALGCGAHLARLRRTAVGAFGEEDAVRLGGTLPDPDERAAFLGRHLVPLDRALAHLPPVVLSAAAARAVTRGVAGSAEREAAEKLAAMERQRPFRLTSEDGELLAVGEMRPGTDGAPAALRLHRVLVDPLPPPRGQAGEESTAA
jgi:tRNA pseudouridine55 synthase